MQLLDAYGRPVRRQALLAEQARPSLAGIRSAWAPSVATGLTPVRLAQILQAAAEGEPAEYLTLAEEMEERDAHYASVLGTRKRVISSVVPTVEPASESPRDREIAEAVQDRIAQHEAWPELVEDLLDAVGKGFSVVEIDWATEASRWWPRAFHHRDPRHFRFDRETGRALRLLDDSDPEGIELAPYRFLRHVPRLKSGLPLRGGLARLVAFGWLCKAYDVKDWIAFIECYGLPLRLGRYGPEATADDVRTLMTAVANIGTDAAAVLPKSMEIEFQKTAEGTGADIFERLADWVDAQVSKAVLGQTMSSDDGASLAQAKVHNEVRHDIAAADARGVEVTIARDLVRPFVDLNWGVQESYPTLRLVIPEPDDVAAMVDGVAKLAPLGVRFKAAELRAKLGLSEPDADDETIGGLPPAPRAPAPGDPGDVALNRLRAVLARNRGGLDHGPDPFATLDRIEAAAALGWRAEVAPMIEPVLRLAAEAGGYDEFRRRLPELLEEMEIGPLVDGLVAAMFQARAEGDLRDV